MQPIIKNWITLGTCDAYTIVYLLSVPQCMYVFCHKYSLSWTTILVIVGDNQEVCVACKVKSPKNQPQFSQIKVKTKFTYLGATNYFWLLLSLVCWLMLARRLCVYNAGLKVDASRGILTVIMMHITKMFTCVKDTQ